MEIYPKCALFLVVAIFNYDRTMSLGSEKGVDINLGANSRKSDY